MKRFPLAVVVALAFSAAIASDDAKTPEKPGANVAEQSALEEFNSLIGGWRGVGMPRRNSTRGAWIETAEWRWDFQDGAAIVYDVKKGRLLQSARVTFDPKTKEYVLAARFAGDAKRTYRGKLQNDKLTAVSKPDDGNEYRMTVRRLNEKRTIVLHESRADAKGQFFRTAEVGYTREGTSLAVEGVDGPECIVTGGKGTTAVMHKGRTYYVCCSGCKQAFDEDPDGVIADYRKKVAARKKKGK